MIEAVAEHMRRSGGGGGESPRRRRRRALADYEVASSGGLSDREVDLTLAVARAHFNRVAAMREILNATLRPTTRGPPGEWSVVRVLCGDVEVAARAFVVLRAPDLADLILYYA